jgi:hypothetical protein
MPHLAFKPYIMWQAAKHIILGSVFAVKQIKNVTFFLIFLAFSSIFTRENEHREKSQKLRGLTLYFTMFFFFCYKCCCCLSEEERKNEKLRR